MNRRAALLQRLDDIGRSLAQREPALALIGLGSVGRELDRLDDYSDLDFFVIVESEHKRDFIDDLSWLSAAYPLAFTFRNSDDGHKFLFGDGIYGEMAVFTPEELATAAYAPGRMIWHRDDVPEAWATPRNWPPRHAQREAGFLLGEAVTNLYVGLCRHLRGEKLSALRFIQQYAVDRVLDLAAIESGHGAGEDLFDRPRRFERRHPALAAELPAFMQGYERNPESAAAIFAYLDARYEIDDAMRDAVTGLL